MTKTAKRISQIAERLSPERQEVLLDIAEGLARPSRFYDSLTPEQLRDLDQSTAEAERGEALDLAQLDARLGKVTGRRYV